MIKACQKMMDISCMTFVSSNKKLTTNHTVSVCKQVEHIMYMYIFMNDLYIHSHTLPPVNVNVKCKAREEQ